MMYGMVVSVPVASVQESILGMDLSEHCYLYVNIFLYKTFYQYYIYYMISVGMCVHKNTLLWTKPHPSKS